MGVHEGTGLDPCSATDLLRPLASHEYSDLYACVKNAVRLLLRASDAWYEAGSLKNIPSTVPSTLPLPNRRAEKAYLKNEYNNVLVSNGIGSGTPMDKKNLRILKSLSWT